MGTGDGAETGRVLCLAAVVEAGGLMGPGGDGAACDWIERVGVEGVGGGAGERARVVRAGGFDAVVVEAPRGMFEGAEAERRLRDVDWLAPRAARHAAIVQAAMDRAGGRGVMPVGFGSVFSGERALGEALGRGAGEIRAFLGSAAGCAEWSVRLTGDRGRMIEAGVVALAGAGGVSGGAGYLMRRKLEERAQGWVRERVVEAVDGLIDRLEGTFRDVVERAVAAEAEAAGGPWVAGHLAFLIGEGEARAFDGAIESAGAWLESGFGLDVELTGPWPAFSFCPRLGVEAGVETGASVETGAGA